MSFTEVISIAEGIPGNHPDYIVLRMEKARGEYFKATGKSIDRVDDSMPSKGFLEANKTQNDMGEFSEFLNLDEIYDDPMLLDEPPALAMGSPERENKTIERTPADFEKWNYSPAYREAFQSATNDWIKAAEAYIHYIAGMNEDEFNLIKTGIEIGKQQTGRFSYEELENAKTAGIKIGKKEEQTRIICSMFPTYNDLAIANVMGLPKSDIEKMRAQWKASIPAA